MKPGYIMFLVGLASMISELYCYFYKRTRLFGFILVVVFHVLTKILFPIGVSCNDHQLLIFFDASFHKRIVYFGKCFHIP
jgi:hypothetical protein